MFWCFFLSEINLSLKYITNLLQQHVSVMEKKVQPTSVVKKHQPSS